MRVKMEDISKIGIVSFVVVVFTKTIDFIFRYFRGKATKDDNQKNEQNTEIVRYLMAENTKQTTAYREDMKEITQKFSEKITKIVDTFDKNINTQGEKMVVMIDQLRYISKNTEDNNSLLKKISRKK